MYIFIIKYIYTLWLNQGSMEYLQETEIGINSSLTSELSMI